MGLLKAIHVIGATFMVGGMTTLVLLRPFAAGAAEGAQKALYDLAWRIQILMVMVGSSVLLVTGLLLWVSERLKLLTGWLLLGILLYLAASALDGAFLSANLRRLRLAARDGQRVSAADAAALTIQLITWLLLLVVVFLMTARPF
ncbi:MAG TPA: DUF2269 family protein [Candidatus Limnocylindrales bacterium]|nr:DUF2269 family protein [Candidatus Limnocylindrales bacterium]